MTFTEHTILITGGTSGIGLGFAKRFAELGNKVIITARNQVRLDTVLAENPDFAGFTSDIDDKNSVLELVNFIKTNFPELDVVMNSAGIMRALNLFEHSDGNLSALTEEIHTNLLGTIAVTQAFLPLLADNHGTVINVSSGLSNLADGAHPIYNLTKAGVHFYSDALREQAKYFGKNLRVVELVPPLVAETNLEEHASTDNPTNMKLSDLINEALVGLENDAERIDAGFAKILHQMGKSNSEENTSKLSAQMLGNYFPKEKGER
ncbi:SDR family oxidoreductase [Lactococcus allomyrinae]|uniref:SDR family NAD(P)-dependent oxidoreductase n=1 Tax=Lactococcus allomyrinae TaxID=2419773 RepID=A0A387BSQ6_9LACT|nr:SDR family oxidoreductase [Lactococcus allomyrinae]AYG01501.1 SDR family NAD(P)-dependent oxidoreductase [Lactococcus allomyrinae]